MVDSIDAIGNGAQFKSVDRFTGCIFGAPLCPTSRSRAPRVAEYAWNLLYSDPARESVRSELDRLQEPLRQSRRTHPRRLCCFAVTLQAAGAAAREGDRGALSNADTLRKQVGDATIRYLPCDFCDCIFFLGVTASL